MLQSAGTGWGYRESFTPEQREGLQKVQNILLEVVALTDNGKADGGPISALASSRMSDLGYGVVTDPAKPHDVVFKIKCEQRKTWEGTTTLGGDADLPDAPSRVWKGPACQLNYLLGTTKIRWQKEVRTDFEDAAAAALAANAPDPGAYAMAKLKERLEQYDFPVLLAAEWGHDERLLKLLDDPRTSQLRKLKVISLLGDMQSDEAAPRLKEALKDKNLAQQAAVALGNLGKESIPILIDMMKTSKDPALQAAAAKGLGQVGALHGDPQIVPPLLEMLEKPGVDRAVLTEVAWAIGKLPDKRAIEPLERTQAKLLKVRDPEDPSWKKLFEAVEWARKQCDTFDQFS
jgi:HEAT repeat protein